MNRDNNKRLEYYDMLKGILIITVVMGHAGMTIFGFNVFWFHMPAFFMVSGVLTKHFIDYEHKDKIIQKAKRLFIPYLSWSVVLYLIFREDNPLKYILRVILAGRMNVTTFSYPFWFIFSLFWGLFLLGSIKCIAKKVTFRGGTYVPLAALMSIWILIHILSMMNINFTLPWGLDCALGGCCYLYVGDLFKFYKYKKWHAVFIVVPVLIYFIFQFCQYSYEINMASQIYKHILLDIVIPFSCFFALYHICKLLENIRPVASPISCLGRCSITIYFVHAAVLHGLEGMYPKEMIVCVAIIIGVALHLLFDKNKWTRTLFL